MKTRASTVIIVEGHVDGMRDAFVRRVRARAADILARVDPPPTTAKVIFTDENGPKGGVDTRCTVVCDMPRRRDVSVSGRGASLEVAFDAAFAALDNTVTRDRDRRRALVRRPKKYFLAKKLMAPDASAERREPAARPKRARRRRVA